MSFTLFRDYHYTISQNLAANSNNSTATKHTMYMCVAMAVVQ